jgi:hypothetical protein
MSERVLQTSVAASVASQLVERDLELHREQDWSVLYDLETPAEQPLGAPGLWRTLHFDPLGACKRAFELPPVEGDAGTLVHWARRTRRGTSPDDWTPPEPEDVASWVDPERMRVRAGLRVARGALLHPAEGHGRLALVFGELAQVPAGLSTQRQAWLAALLTSVAERWRLVRVGLDPKASAVRAEVDLSGVPEAYARPLVQLSLEALRGAVGWVLPTLNFLVDEGAESRALERHTPSLRS